MNMEKVVPLKQLMDTVEGIINNCTKEELGEILREMAKKVPKDGRLHLLDQLYPYTKERRKEQPHEEKGLAEDLLEKVDQFMAALEMEMQNKEEPSYEDDYYDDEEGTFYAEFKNDLEDLFDKTNTAFDYKHFRSARTAYEKLFQVFGMEDEYGGGIRVYDLPKVDIGSSLTRYYRSVLETEPAQDRPEILYHKQQEYYEYGRGISLKNILDITPEELSQRDEFLSNWIEFLKIRDEKLADFYLREAVILKKGIEGIKTLALSEGCKRPRAYLDWLRELVKNRDFASAIEAGQGALQVLDKELPIYSAISDQVKIAAENLGREDLVEESIWNSFFAKPDLHHLLELRKYFSNKGHYLEIMNKASARINDYLKIKPPSIAEGPIEKDEAEKYASGSKITLAHAYLLSKDWEKALALAHIEKEYGWSYSDNPQGLIVSVFLAIILGEPVDNQSPNLKELFGNYVEGQVSYLYLEKRDLELKKIYSEYIPQSSLGQKEEDILDWCVSICEKRVNHIVGNQHRKSYDKAATLTVACSEVLKAKGKIAEATNLVSHIKIQFPRHRAFQDELSRALIKR